MSKVVLFLLSFLAFIPASFAGNFDSLTLYVGQFDAFNNDNVEVPQFGMEYRFAPVYENIVRPVVGINGTVESSIYAYTGANFDFEVMDKFYVIPNFVVGAYEEGNSEDLGGTIEFRTGLELAYELDNGQRLGIAYNHISNAGIYEDNPGAETILFTYSIPVGKCK